MSLDHGIVGPGSGGLRYRCFECSYEMDAQAGLSHDAAPAPGDVCLCSRCAAIAVYGEEGMRPPTLKELRTFLRDPEIRRGITAIHIVNAQRGRLN